MRNERLQKNDFKKNGKRDFIFGAYAYPWLLEHKKAGQEEIKDIFSIKVMGFDITIKNMLIAEAVLSLTEKGRNIVLMSFFLGMTDKEIGKMLHLGQSTVNYHKNNNLKKMRKFMEEHEE